MYTCIMLIDKRSFMIGACVGMILLAMVGLVNAVSYKNRIGVLKDEIKSKNSMINQLEHDLISSRENCTQLASRLMSLKMNNSELVLENMVLKKAVLIVGQEEIKETLVRYAEVSVQYEKLQGKYDDLLLKYNNLLA